jgi:hypothetical protein
MPDIENPSRPEQSPEQSKEERIAWLKEEIARAHQDTGDAEEGGYEPIYTRDEIAKLEQELQELENS